MNRKRKNEKLAGEISILMCHAGDSNNGAITTEDSFERRDPIFSPTVCE